MKELMNKWVSERRNERMKKQMIEIQWMEKRRGRLGGRKEGEWKKEWTKEGMNEWRNEQTQEWNEWANEWMIGGWSVETGHSIPNWVAISFAQLEPSPSTTLPRLASSLKWTQPASSTKDMVKMRDCAYRRSTLSSSISVRRQSTCTYPATGDRVGPSASAILVVSNQLRAYLQVFVVTLVNRKAARHW